MTISVLIVGGGASGTLMSISLLRGNLDVNVTLVERSGAPGRGLAYATSDDCHVLNVIPGKMSAFADDSDHFRRWLISRGTIGPDEAFVFVPRRHYADYLETTLQKLAARTGRLQTLTAEVVSVRPGEHATAVQLAGGVTLTADFVILATGHDTPYAPPSFDGGAKDLPILVLGTGLSMVDTCLSLVGSGRRVIAMSRRGLLPASHREGPPAPVEVGDLPLGSSASQFVHWFRRFARRTEARSGDWRPAVDALRPYTQRLWASWDAEARSRFLRHLKPWWGAHRHRLPAALHRRLQTSLAEGSVQVIAGTPLRAGVGSEPQAVTFRRRGSVAVETMTVGAVIDCRGLIRDWRDRPGSLVSCLLADGHARVDEMGLGIEVTCDDEVVATNGRVQRNLFAIGPLTRGRWFEIEAIPEIRAQCDGLTAHLQTLAQHKVLAN